jgi:hypothetical protein
MERAVAIRKLGKLLGKRLGYRVDSGAPDAEERAAARQQLPALQAAEKLAADAMEARRRAILAADPEYQAMVAEHKAARDRRHKVSGVTDRYRITVGTISDLFFHVKAQGDSWEDVIAKLTADRRPERMPAE